MKSKKVILVVVALLLKFPVVFSDDSSFSVEYLFNPVLENDQWVIENTTLREIPGEPLVPYYSASILLPQDAVVKDVRVRTDTPFVQRGFDLPWGQPPCTFSDESNDMPQKVGKNEAIYNSDELYPGEIYEVVSVGYCRGFPILNVLLYPMQYQPKSRVVKLYSKFTVEIYVEKGMKNEMYRGLPEDKEFVAQIVDNPDMVNTYSDKKSLVASESLEPGTYKYIIITNEALEPAFRKLAEWKANFLRGARVVMVEWIYDNSPGYDNQEKIRNFIKDAYNDWGTRYCLLGGGVSVVPYRGLYVTNLLDFPIDRVDYDMTADMYYACLEGTFDANGNHVYGESGDDVDFIAEVAVGRAPAETIREAENFVRKVIAYEQADKPKVCQFHQARLNTATPDSIRIAENCEQHVPGDYEKRELFEENGTVTRDDWKNAWAGNPLVFQHTGHGLVDGYDINYQLGGKISWSWRNVDELTNKDFWPVHTSIACLSGRFKDDGDCLAEAYIKSEAGAIACIMNDNVGAYSISDPVKWSGEFVVNQFKALFDNEMEHLGDMLNLSKSWLAGNAQSNNTNSINYRWCYYGINLLGDPETPILTKRLPPEPHIYITYPQLQQTVSDTVTITTHTYHVDTVKFFINYKLVHTDEIFPFTYNWDTTKYDNGTHQILVIGESSTFEGNHIAFVRVDNSNSSLCITNPQNNEILKEIVTINTTTSGIDTVEFYIDGNLKYTDTSAPFTYDWDTTAYLRGYHSIKVEGYKGGISKGSHQIEVYVDNTVLNSLSIAYPKNGQEVSGIVTINTSSSGIDTVEFYIDGNLKYTDSSEPFAYEWDTTACPNGEHTIEVEGYKNGVLEKTSQITVTVRNGTSSDTMPPETLITSGPYGITTTNNATFQWTGSDDVTSIADLVYSYYLEGYDTGWSPYTPDTRKIYYNLQNGAYTFKVRARDGAGHVDPSPATRSFTVNYTSSPDTTPPDTIIISGPNGTVPYDDVVFRWTGSDNVTPAQYLLCSYYLKGFDSNWSEYTSDTTKIFYDLPNGEYTLYIRARDEEGNVDPTPATRSFAVNCMPQDTTPPITTIISGPTGTIDYNTVTFSWTGSDNVTPTQYLVYSYKLEGYDTVWSQYTSETSKTYYNLSNGIYFFYVKAQDEAGNISEPVARLFTVGSSSSLKITDPQDGQTISGTFTITADAVDINTVYFYINNTHKYTDPFSPYTWLWDTTEYPDGEYTIKVEGYKNNVVVATDQVTVNVSNPSITITNPQDGQTVSGTTIITTDAVDIESVYFYVDDKYVYYDNIAPFTYEWDTLAYNDGDYTVKVVGIRYGAFVDTDEITVTIQNILPSPTIQFNTYSIDDDNRGNSYGNTDGVINPGEFINLLIYLENTGTETVNGITATVSTESPYVNPYNAYSFDSDLYFGNIPGGAILSGDDLDFMVSSDAPDGTVITFDLTIIDSNGTTWYDSFDVTVTGSDTLPPRAVTLKTSPQILNVGDTVTIMAFVEEGDDMSSGYVTAQIETSSKALVASIDLYDDGMHNDGNAGDRVFGGSWTVTQPETDYIISILTSDNSGNSTEWTELAGFTTKTFTVSNKILLVDDDNYNLNALAEADPYQSYYTDALDANGLLYDIWEYFFRGSPDSSILTQYDMVIWLTGDTYGESYFTQGYYAETLSSIDQSNLITYLESGGTLFISGQDIGHDLSQGDLDDQAFYNNYLHADFVQDGANLYGLYGITYDPMTDGLYITIFGGDGANNQYYASEINPINGATIIFTYDHTATAGQFGLQETAKKREPLERRREMMEKTNEHQLPRDVVSSGSAAISVDTGLYKVVYFAFGFEGIDNSANRNIIMRKVTQWLHGSTGEALPQLFDTSSYLVVGDDAYCTDVLGTAKISYGLALGGSSQNPEGRTHTILTNTEHDTGNLILVGGPAINPVAAEFDGYFSITYNYDSGGNPPVFEISAEGSTITLNLNDYPNQDICIVYLAEYNGRNVMLVWGYGWRGTYAGSAFMGDPANWQAYEGAHMLMLRWTDSNADGLVQMSEITVETYV